MEAMNLDLKPVTKSRLTSPLKSLKSESSYENGLSDEEIKPKKIPQLDVGSDDEDKPKIKIELSMVKEEEKAIKIDVKEEKKFKIEDTKSESASQLRVEEVDSTILPIPTFGTFKRDENEPVLALVVPDQDQVEATPTFSNSMNDELDRQNNSMAIDIDREDVRNHSPEVVAPEEQRTPTPAPHVSQATTESHVELDLQNASMAMAMDIDDVRNHSPEVVAPHEQRTSTPAPVVSQAPTDHETTNDLQPQPQPPPQAKRRRIVMDAVEVPSLKEIQKRKAAQREDEIKKLDKMKNPKTNMKKVEACFDVDTIRDRLRPIGLDLYPINLDRDLQDVMVPREFISSIYGGGLQCAWVNVAKKTQKRLNNSKYIEFLYLSLDLNCHAPEMPGSPGLYFSPGSQVAFPIEGVQRVITRIAKTDIGPVWQYQGQYELTPAKSLTAKEWASVKHSVRQNWAHELDRSTVWGRGPRVRIALRRALGRASTEEEFEEAFWSERSYDEITKDDIAQALLRGEESVAVWTMKCVGYDEEFQRDLATKYRTNVWTPRPRAKKGKKQPKGNKAAKQKGGSKKGRGKAEATRSRSGQKRKRELEEADEESEDENEEEEQEEDEEEEEAFYPVYRPRGTRSRPIVVG